MTKITVEALVRAPRELVWTSWSDPEAIVRWNAASEDWHTTASSVDLRVGGAFSSRMEAKDGSAGFDFEGTYTRVEEPSLLEFDLGDGRPVIVEFLEMEGGVLVRETFEADDVFSGEQQRQGWQAILDSFARYVESQAGAGANGS